MRKWSLRILVVVLVLIALAVVVIPLRPREPRLSISYLAITNVPSNPPYQIVSFLVTNKGNGTALNYKQGEIEFSDTGQKKLLAARCNVERLGPGEQGVIEVRLWDPMPGRWRFTCFFAHAGFRTSVNRRVPPRFVPQRLKGVPLNVKATSDWIDNEVSSSLKLPQSTSDPPKQP